MRGRGMKLGVLAVLGLLVAGAVPALAVDYAGALWEPAASCNYTASNREASYDIRWIVVHTAEGSFSGTYNWFMNCAAQASAHFVVAQDGRVAQMVLAKDVAWHAGNWAYNTHSLGIEHEGFTSQASTWTESMYVASAKLTRFLADRYGVPLVHPTGVQPADPMGVAGGIIGHSQVPDPNNPALGGGASHHTDPGAYFDWSHYMDLVRGNGASLKVSIVAPAAEAWTRGTITAQGTTNEDASLAWARWWMDGSVTKWATAAPHLWTYDTRGYADGAHTLAFEAKDSAGTVASASITTRIDNTPPIVAIARPAPRTLNIGGNSVPDPAGLTVAVGDVPVQASASDAMSGVARVAFLVDGALRASDASPPYAWTWPAGDEALGGHTLTVTAWDVAGNSASASLRVDVTVPTSLAGLENTIRSV